MAMMTGIATSTARATWLRRRRNTIPNSDRTRRSDRNPPGPAELTMRTQFRWTSVAPAALRAGAVAPVASVAPVAPVAPVVVSAADIETLPGERHEHILKIRTNHPEPPHGYPVGDQFRAHLLG